MRTKSLGGNLILRSCKILIKTKILIRSCLAVKILKNLRKSLKILKDLKRILPDLNKKKSVFYILRSS